MTVDQETAARLDTAIDSLLREDVQLIAVGSDHELLDTARLLRDSLPRYHPRFGFEERLAGRLAALGRAPHEATMADAARPRLEPIPFPAAAAVSPRQVPATPPRRRRGLLAGGAIASGFSIVIPLAGAAVLIWRRGRSSGGLL